MSNSNNKPTTDNIQSVSYPGSSLPPSFLEILRVHSQLTNTPFPDNHFDAPNDHQIYFDIQPDSNRHNKAITQKFYIVDSPVKGIKHPTIYMVGNTSLLYTLRFTSTGIFCNCLDVNPACKRYVWFLLCSLVFLFSLFRRMTGMTTQNRNRRYLSCASTEDTVVSSSVSQHSHSKQK
mmetsp:Transcript_23749/g.27510  ORF Transcript_23749/g.27510 Transcript_23749/m.27510 type:complete len:177 (+) Transcript_23749:973-1503(+)